MKSATLSQLLLKSLLVTALALLSVLTLQPLLTSNATEDPKSKTPVVSDAKPAQPQADELGKLIEAAIDESQFRTARWGVSVLSLDGRTIYQRDGNKLFTPASNMKIYTTAVALDLLGADYRWRTSVYAAAQPDSSGNITGDLILYGRGAPDLKSQAKEERSSLASLADDLYQRGVRKVSGNIIGDESYFRGDTLGNGWQWTDIQWYFGAEASALSVNGNEVDVNIVPSNNGDKQPQARTSDTTGYVTVQNRLANVDRHRRATLGLYRELSTNNVQVWGEFPPGAKGFGARLSVHKPALWAARLFAEALKNRGIAVGGEAITRDSRMPPTQRFDPAQAVELANASSQPLGEIAKQTNKLSLNLFAELILRTLGRERGEMLPQTEPPGRELGDDKRGLSVMRLWLTRAGIPVDTLALHDGSGLSRLNLVTPESAARLLVSMSQRSSSETFKQSLPISGRDGTLAGRLKTVDGRVLAKTGYLTYNNSLSGYVTTSKGEILAFSVMCNDQTRRGDSNALIDKITLLIAEFPDFSDKRSQKPQEKHD